MRWVRYSLIWPKGEPGGYKFIKLDTTMKTQLFDLELTNAQAWALAEFLKRTGYTDIREKAVDDSEASDMQSALGELERTLARYGYSPR
jgi:hypothetical protein